MAWTFILSDHNGNVMGELTNAHDRAINRTLNGISSARCTIRGDHPLAADLYSTPALLLRCYDDNKVLRFHGSVTSLNDNVDRSDYTIGLTAQDPGRSLDRRLDIVTQQDFESKDIGAIGADYIMENQDIHAPPNGIKTTGTDADYNVGAIVPWTREIYPHALQDLVMLSESLAGFDWYVAPIERQLDYNSDWTIGELQLDAVIGTTKPEAIFEWGTGRNNVESWTRLKDWTAQRNVILSSSGRPNTPSDPNPAASNLASVTTYGSLWDVIDSFGIEDYAMRLALCEEHVAVRGEPRQIYRLTPTPTLVTQPVFGVDYDLGDFVTWRAKHNGAVLFDGQVRVYGVEIAIDDNGQARITPNVEPV